MALKQVGVIAVVKDLPAFVKGMDVINEATRQTAERIKKTVGNSAPVQAAGKGIEQYTDKIKDMVTETLRGVPVIGKFADEITASLSPTMLATAAIAALTVAIVGLGIEGGKIKGVRDSFDLLTAGVGLTSDALLGKLRAAVAGTVSDFELMRTTNVALAGATGEFGKQFGEALPRVLELARLQAQATGKDVGYLVDSLISGIKRASPMLIDNTGIVLKVGDANEQLAQKLGKTVEALTAEEKQIAVLNAVLEAGDRTTRLYGDAQEYASIKAARAQTTITNMVNSVQVAVEPIASAVLNVVNLVLDNVSKIVAGIMTIAQPIINIISTIVGAITNILAPIVSFIGDAIGGVFTAIGSIVETVLAPFQLLIEILGKVGGAVVNFVVTPFRGLLNFLLGVVNFIVGLARGMLKAGAALIGALSAGILHAANSTLVPAVVAVATLIADFLVGQSPPPKGPLSTIDKGGAATMEAWLQGFVGVSLDPVDQVAASVTASMGAIANMSLDAVKERIKGLDAALQPFQDRLNIIKAKFDALKPVTEAAFSAIDRQLDVAVQALANGSQAAAEQVRNLDMQRQALLDYVSAQQDQIDNAQIQYALAQAQQAQERVLLGIRQRQLEIDQEKDPVKKAEKEKALKAEKEKAGSGTPSVGGVGGDFGVPKAPGDSGFVDELTGAFDTAFQQGGGPEELAKLNQGGKLIQDQFGRIGKAFDNSPIVKSLKGMGESITQAFDPNNPDSFLFKVLQGLAYQSNPDNADGIVGWFVNLPRSIANATNGLFSTIQTEVVNPIVNGFKSAFDATNPNSLPAQLTAFFSGTGTLYTLLSTPMTWFQANIVTPFNTLFNDFFNSLFSYTDPSTFAGKIALFFMGSGEGTLQGIFLGPIEWFNDNVVTPAVGWFNDLFKALFDVTNSESFAGKAWNFWMGSGEGTLQGIITNFGNWVKAAIANPFIAGFNAVIGAIETFINSTIIKAMNDLASVFYSLIDAVGQGGSEIGQKLRAFSNTQVSFGRIPALAKGGILGSGAFQAGEHGREIGMSAAPFAMFSNKFVKAIDLFANTVAKPMPLPITGGGNYTTNNSSDSQVNNFYGVSGTDDAARRIAMMRAFR